jgi:pyridinium-3,5-biscarboxylic acid mononucleotide sulfurtransferase
MRSCVVAYSGGTDSAFLAKAAADTLGRNALAATIVTPLLSVAEKKAASRLASGMRIRHMFLAAGFPSAVSSNPIDRCYHCKKSTFKALRRLAKAQGASAVVEGSNADDDGDYRPGMRAIQESGARSPLREAGLTKQEIRSLSRRMGLKSWNKPSSACLASRFPYGEPITRKKLAMVERAEEYLRSLGLRQVRVRAHNGLARIEAEPAKLRALMARAKEVSRTLRRMGFTYVTVDIDGFRSGAMNEAIAWKRKRS